MAEVQSYDGEQALALLDELAVLYERVYAEPPYNSAPKFSRARFLVRTREQVRSPGFSLVTARQDGLLVGFAFGFAIRPGGWWAVAGAPPLEVLEATKFAVVELVVDAVQRGQGLGGALLDALLAERAERFATLAAVIGADAYEWYLRRGWVKVAEFRGEPPYSDALVLELGPGSDEAVR
ncbi:GNAT family N-acetyltransferase [Actinomadura adrarensis]|uniref:GNAT family N-acetyltransferase n=1 Tax=Actinomadura adrarensis TaxID=1819600 RepID=A0ABW3CBG2_9ACTN